MITRLLALILVTSAALPALAAEKFRAPQAHPVTWQVFDSWPMSKQVIYVREMRQIYAKFETPSPMKMAIVDDGQFCLVGGMMRETVAGPNGRRLCPTNDNECEPLGDDGFLCGLIYDAACVSRFPVKTLTKRCEAKSKNFKMTRADYESRRDMIDTVVAKCEEGSFTGVNAENCEAYLARMTHLNVKTAGGSDDDAAKAVTKLVKPVPVPQTPIKPTTPAAPMCKGVPWGIKNDGGGYVDSYLQTAARLKRQSAKVEIDGMCASACILLVGAVPTSNVCVRRGATLGFHQTFDPQTGVVDKAYTEMVVAKYYTPELKDLWRRHYSPSKDVNWAGFNELSQIYPICGSAGDKCASSPPAGPYKLGGTQPDMYDIGSFQ